MPQCSVKNCKNHTSRTLKTRGVSFFNFPRDPFRCEKWASVIARQRCDEFFKPSRGSVVCSDHFLESDVYMTPKGRKRLHKTAVPQIVEDEDSAFTSNVDEESAGKKCFYENDMKKYCLLHQQDEDDQVKQNDSILDKSSSESNPQINIISNNLEVLKSSSALSIGLMLKMEKELCACKRRITIKNRQIDNLRKKFLRLKNRNIHLKNIIVALKQSAKK